VFFVFSHVLERLRFDPVGQRFLVGRCLADHPPGRRGLSAQHELLADHPRMWYGPFACRDASWVVLLVLSDYPPWVADRPCSGR
jgi:hypothetical protein